MVTLWGGGNGAFENTSNAASGKVGAGAKLNRGRVPWCTG